MSRFTRFVTRHQKSVITAFIVAAVLSVFFSLQVSVNYDMVDYLPEDASPQRLSALWKTSSARRCPMPE
jgi:predicted RND superfamily exporter protein